MKIFVWDKYTIIIAVLVLALVVVSIPAGRRLGVETFSGEKKALPIYSVQTPEKVVALTFDAAWGNEDVADMMKIFDQYGVKTTFFVVGEWVDKYPETVKALYDAGHEIASHSDTHLHMAGLQKSRITEEIEGCEQKITALTGARGILFRPPYGEYDSNLIRTVNDMGRLTIQWDVDSLDWKDLSTEQMNARVTARVGNGSIILFHCGTKNTAGALPRIIENLKGQGYSFKTVSELIYKENYYIDVNGRQHPSA